MTGTKQFIAWYRYDGEEDFTIISGMDEEEARYKFYSSHDNLIEIHQITEDEAYLAFI